VKTKESLKIIEKKFSLRRKHTKKELSKLLDSSDG
jgi:hypothetical protein